MIFVFDRIENIVGKGENADYQHFLLFPQCFLKGFLLKVIKCQGLCGEGLTHYQQRTYSGMVFLPPMEGMVFLTPIEDSFSS